MKHELLALALMGGFWNAYLGAQESPSKSAEAESIKPPSQVLANSRFPLQSRTRTFLNAQESLSPFMREVDRLLLAGNFDEAANKIEEISEDVEEEGLASLRAQLALELAKKGKSNEASEQASKALAVLLPKLERLVIAGDLAGVNRIAPRVFLAIERVETDDSSKLMDNAIGLVEKRLSNTELTPLHTTYNKILRRHFLPCTLPEQLNGLLDSNISIAETLLRSHPSDPADVSYAIQAIAIKAIPGPSTEVPNKELFERMGQITRTNFKATQDHTIPFAYCAEVDAFAISMMAYQKLDAPGVLEIVVKAKAELEICRELATSDNEKRAIDSLNRQLDRFLSKTPMQPPTAKTPRPSPATIE